MVCPTGTWKLLQKFGSPFGWFTAQMAKRRNGVYLVQGTCWFQLVEFGIQSLLTFHSFCVKWLTDEIKQSTDGKESYGGIMWELLMIMKQAKNISFTLVGSSDGLWGGTCYSSNNCTGMIGMVNRKEVHMALGIQQTTYVDTLISWCQFDINCLI